MAREKKYWDWRKKKYRRKREEKKAVD